MLDRRTLLAAGSAAVAFGGLRHALAEPAPRDANRLVPDPAGLFDLPPGFRYVKLSEVGTPMSDGLPTPGRFDGMGAFTAKDGGIVLVRNHEYWPNNANGPFGAGNRLLTDAIRARMFDKRADPVALGGTVTLVLDASGTRVRQSFLSLAGTWRNCAGGVTPWGSWLSCEEPKHGLTGRCEPGHGWVFEVPSSARGLIDAVPLEDLGRFNHEAVAVDRRTGILYLTEDQEDGLFYRFLPNVRGELAKGGRLQALAVDGAADAANRDGGWPVGAERRTRWIDLRDVHAPDDDLRLRGRKAGATRFVRGEGLAASPEGDIYFTCTEGGRNAKGQVFRYRPSPREGQRDEADRPGRIALFVEPDDLATLDMPDNICMTPWGSLLVCEDGGSEQYLRLVAPNGQVTTIGRNAHKGKAELAGVCFAPDGRTLFVNIYNPGFTLAVQGPWSTLVGG